MCDPSPQVTVIVTGTCFGKNKPVEGVDLSGTSVDFVFSFPSVEQEGGVFSEYHCNLYFSEVKQISLGGRIRLLWDPRSPSDS